MKFIEMEFKYRADDITLDQFSEYCESAGTYKHITASGWDYFYDSTRTEGFARHRVGSDFNQLTYKRKTTDANNYVRQEDNLDLSPGVSVSQVSSFLHKFGYKHNTAIFKNCFIYKYDTYTLVYYCIYDTNLKQVGKFIEIEMSEDYPWSSEEQAWEQLIQVEKACKAIGLSPQCRMRKSLYELVTQ